MPTLERPEAGGFPRLKTSLHYTVTFKPIATAEKMPSQIMIIVIIIIVKIINSYQ